MGVPAVELKGITKTFGSIVANSDCSLTVEKGEILSVLGENGSGKTTLMNMLAGIYFPDAGQIFVNGEEVVIRSPKDAFKYSLWMCLRLRKISCWACTMKKNLTWLRLRKKCGRSPSVTALPWI